MEKERLKEKKEEERLKKKEKIRKRGVVKLEKYPVQPWLVRT